MAFVREAESDLGQYDMWRMAFIHWPTIPWKRSALAYLPGLIAKVSPAWEHVSVLEALDRWATVRARGSSTVKSHSSHWCIRSIEIHLSPETAFAGRELRGRPPT